MKPRISPGASVQLLPDGEALILSTDESQAIALNALGTAVVHLSDGSRTSEMISQFIIERFPNQDPGQIARDVDAFVEQLVGNGILEFAD